MPRLRAAAWLLVLMLLWALPASAEKTPKTPEVFISVRVETEGVLPEERETLQAELKALTVDAPMPNGTSKDVYKLMIPPTGEAKLGPIKCEKLGEYKYTIRLLPGENPNLVYDQQVYDLKIQVAVDEETGERQVIVVLYQDEESNKFEDVLFVNQSLLPPTPTPPPAEISPTPKPTHSGNLTPTGVRDYWPLYVTGMGILGCISIAMIVVLCRKETYDEAEDE